MTARNKNENTTQPPKPERQPPKSKMIPIAVWVAMRKALRAVQRDATRQLDRQLTDETRDMVSAAIDAHDDWVDGL